MNSFENFYADMGSRPSPDHSIERIDNSQGYCKENCKWATRLEQRRNSRLIRMVERDGIVKPMWQWSQELGIPYRKFQGMARAGKDGFTRLPNPSLAKVREAAKSRP
jgi:hypothetical protein